MSALYIPTLSHWTLGNSWSGSLGRGSYYVTPKKTEEGEACLFVEIWTGPTCYELSRAEETEQFPVTEEGLAAMERWLEARLTALDLRAREA